MGHGGLPKPDLDAILADRLKTHLSTNRNGKAVESIHRVVESGRRRGADPFACLEDVLTRIRWESFRDTTRDATCVRECLRQNPFSGVERVERSERSEKQTVRPRRRIRPLASVSPIGA